MIKILAFLVLIYAAWRAVINGIESSSVSKQHGNFPPSGTPNYMGRMWGWIVIGIVAAMASGIFSGGTGDCIGRWC